MANEPSAAENHVENRKISCEDARMSPRKTPTHELVYRQIRQMILFGELAPGQAVTIQGLVTELGSGITPVREALRRLTASGALDFKGNRRICVPELTTEQLDELVFARLAIEPELARQATVRMADSDIDRLSETDAMLNHAIAQGDVRGYLEQNFKFHDQLYAQSDAQILMAISRALWLRVGPSLRVVCGQFGTFNLPDKHKEALAAMRARDADGVAQAIREDIQQGYGQIKASLTGAVQDQNY